MGWYSRVIFPRICDLALGTALVSKYRRELLEHAIGEVLEIGFGTGLNLAHYPGHIHKLTVIDPNRGMHRLGRKRIESSRMEVDQRILSSEQMPFEEATFDCAVSTFTLCSIPDVDQAMREVFRVLRPGGHFLFLEHGISPDARVQKWQRRLNGLQTRIGDGCHLDRNIREIVGGRPFSKVDADEFYLDIGPKTHGYVYRGVGTK
jgi:ubiquinone/menaquinone biosynthesis C-methylase UbiE